MILFGPPGVGKSVYCSMLEKDLGLKQFSTGEFSRFLRPANLEQNKMFNHEEVLDIESKVKNGELLNDEIINKIVKPRLIEAQSNGIILDGFPRTLNQAKFLSENLRIDMMFSISLRQDILIRKLIGRRICPQCSQAYNIVTINEDGYDIPPMLPKNNPCQCDNCKVEFIQRHDDVQEVIEKRQLIYMDQMKDILDYYRESGLLCEFEPKKGINDYPKMLDAVIEFVNKREVV
ncbi:adenylate kinase [Stylonychia lemnae]|uniref:Adenylate kinase n=1 Tax=Stylonychia lemnae TaxID=5949 RepID=A0A078ATC2_STYLE|nr:adenylate kinase [Stylonychia lemnae]|eukprot:CDW85454.1 adenylate kinase [Stylonychia lemnae]